MTARPNDAHYLDLFASWLRTLGEDADAFGTILVSNEEPESVRRYATAGLNYLFKSLDLIPDGIDDLGYLDDAFVLRVVSHLAKQESPSQLNEVMSRLAADAKDIQSFLGEEYVRLEVYVRILRKGTARGRTVEDIMTSFDARRAFLSELEAWTKEYSVPSFRKDPKTLLKLKGFLSAKLS